MTKKGWKKEPARHSLSARGVKTKKKTTMLRHTSVTKHKSVTGILNNEFNARYKRACDAWMVDRDIDKAERRFDTLNDWSIQIESNALWSMMSNPARRKLADEWDSRLDALAEFFDLVRSGHVRPEVERDMLRHLESEGGM